MNDSTFHDARCDAKQVLTARGVSSTRSIPRAFHAIRHRRQQRGAAVFVVMMAIVVLTGVGVWAVHLSGLTTAASGYSRAAAQTLYMGEMGVLAGSSYLSVPGVSDANYAVARATPDDCWSVTNSVSKPREFCKALPMVDIDTLIATETQSYTGGPFTLVDQTSGGSLGARSSVEGNFIVEMSEPRQAFVEGMEAGSLTYQTVTLTSYGFVRPAAPGANFCGAQAASGNAVATRMGMRARMILGPLTN